MRLVIDLPDDYEPRLAELTEWLAQTWLKNRLEHIVSGRMYDQGEPIGSWEVEKGAVEDAIAEAYQRGVTEGRAAQ